MDRALLSYAIDDQDRIVKVDEGYYAFAAENGWGEAGSSLGRSLWDFVSGEELKNAQRMLLRRVRGGLGSVDLPFRCDGPDVRREMDIRIAAQSAGQVVLFSASLRQEEERDRPQLLLSATAPRGEEVLTMCGWCDRFRVDGEWVEVEEAAARLELFRRAEMPTISHGLCPDCSRVLVPA